MSGIFERLVDWASSRGWQARLRVAKAECLPASIVTRYPRIPADFLDFIASVEQLVAPDDQAWFNCCDDFRRTTGFRWNELELISLKAAQTEGDAKWLKCIGAFWATHLPVFISVRGDYRYFAISMEDGSVVEGHSPELEEAATVATSFVDFVERIVSGRVSLQ